MIASRIIKLVLATTALLSGCGLLDDSATRKSSNGGLIATPVTYYSTSRARYLGVKYKENLDRLVERIVRNPKTANLQFANNIASVGGIGFFTHSATKTADERYLEVVLAAPETFETKGAHNNKVNRLFVLYGTDLLATLSADNDIYQDKELTGYALNLSWRNVIADPAGNRVTLERAIVYLSKEKSRIFLRREISQDDLLAGATIFAVEEDGPLNLVSYRAPDVHQEYRPTIREDDISPMQTTAKPTKSSAPVKTEPLDQVKETLPRKEPAAKIAPSKAPEATVQKSKALPAKTPAIPVAPAVIAAPTEAPVGEAMPVELVELEAAAPVSSPIPETEEATKIIKPIRKIAEPTTNVMHAPGSVTQPKLPPPAPVELGQPAVVAPGPEIKEAAQVNLARPNESAAPARLVDAPKLSPVEPNTYLPTESPVALNVPGFESPKVEKAARTTMSKPEASVAKTLSASAAATPVTPKPLSQKPEATPIQPGTEPLGVGISVRSPITVPPTPDGKAEAKPIEIASAPPAFFKSALPEVPVAPPLLVSAQPLISSRPAAIEAPMRPFVPTSQVGIEKPSVKPSPEQLASLPNKPIEAAPAKAVVARPGAPKPLEGFIIQVTFNDKERAQRWAEGMEKKGFAVSVTEAGNDGALRVRLGNFVLRDDAERQLKAIKQDGLAGIILNLPQAFRPEARTSIP